MARTPVQAGEGAQPLLPLESMFQTLGAEYNHLVFLCKTRLMASLVLRRFFPIKAQTGEDICPRSHSRARDFRTGHLGQY